MTPPESLGTPRARKRVVVEARTRATARRPHSPYHCQQQHRCTHPCAVPRLASVQAPQACNSHQRHHHQHSPHPPQAASPISCTATTTGCATPMACLHHSPPLHSSSAAGAEHAAIAHKLRPPLPLLYTLLCPPPPPTPNGAVTRVVCPLGPPVYAGSSTATQAPSPGRLQGRAALSAPWSPSSCRPSAPWADGPVHDNTTSA